MLARGEIQLVGATTLNEYRKFIEKDAALERRFSPVTVNEPSEKDTIQILKGIRDKYEAHHNVKITDEAIEAAVKLSIRYVNDRFLPDKAIDILDEACSKINLNDKTKNIVFKITDENLLNKTGGIVQGMSGSPIIQDNKIIGAVTHVIVNDCTKGYGIFITNMLEEAEN